jgi:hypothetical protein
MRLIRFIPTLICASLLLGGPTLAADQGRGRGHEKHAQSDPKQNKNKNKNKGNPADDRGNDVDRARFNGLDRNRDGVVTRAEWNGNDQSFRVHDWNRDGVLSGGEVRPGAARPDPVSRYASWDHNRDGVLSAGEWRGTRDEFRRLDGNRDGVLTRFELGIR